MDQCSNRVARSPLDQEWHATYSIAMYIAYSREFQYKKIENTRQLFVDDDVVACVRNVKRSRHAPQKHGSNPLIVRDKPWEVVPYFRTPTFNVARAALYP